MKSQLWIYILNRVSLFNWNKLWIAHLSFVIFSRFSNILPQNRQLAKNYPTVWHKSTEEICSRRKPLSVWSFVAINRKYAKARKASRIFVLCGKPCPDISPVSLQDSSQDSNGDCRKEHLVDQSAGSSAEDLKMSTNTQLLFWVTVNSSRRIIFLCSNFRRGTAETSGTVGEGEVELRSVSRHRSSLLSIVRPCQDVSIIRGPAGEVREPQFGLCPSHWRRRPDIQAIGKFNSLFFPNTACEAFAVLFWATKLKTPKSTVHLRTNTIDTEVCAYIEKYTPWTRWTSDQYEVWDISWLLGLVTRLRG